MFDNLIYKIINLSAKHWWNINFKVKQYYIGTRLESLACEKLYLQPQSQLRNSWKIAYSGTQICADTRLVHMESPFYFQLKLFPAAQIWQ